MSDFDIKEIRTKLSVTQEELAKMLGVSVRMGQFKFTPETGILACKESRGWDFTIFVDFEDSDNAVFDISGKVQSQKVKVKRPRKAL